MQGRGQPGQPGTDHDDVAGPARDGAHASSSTPPTRCFTRGATIRARQVRDAVRLAGRYERRSSPRAPSTWATSTHSLALALLRDDLRQVRSCLSILPPLL